MSVKGEQAMASSSKSSGNQYVQIGGGSSDLNISLHPLPILNISEHHTRNKLLATGSEPRKIIGALLGTQSGRDVSIINTFDLVVHSTAAEGDVVMDDNAAEGAIDLEFLEMRREQFKQVFPTLDFIGWYSTGREPTAEDVTLHKQLLPALESPLFLLLSPDQVGAAASTNLPVKIYESAVTSTAEFLEVKFSIETGEAERVAVDGAATGGGDGTEGSLVANLTTQRNAVKMLMDRIAVLLEYVDKVAAGTVKADHALLRQIKALIATLPAMNTEGYQDEMRTEQADVQLTSYLASITKQLNSLNDLTDKHLSLYPSGTLGGEFDAGPGRSMGMGMMGMAGGRKKRGAGFR